MAEAQKGSHSAFNWLKARGGGTEQATIMIVACERNAFGEL